MKKLILIVCVSTVLWACEKEDFQVQFSNPILEDGATEIVWRPVLGWSYDESHYGKRRVDGKTTVVFYCDTVNPPQKKVFENLPPPQPDPDVVIYGTDYGGIIPEDCKLLPNRKYYWRCVAISGKGNHVSSEIYSFTTIDTQAIENKKWKLQSIGFSDEEFYHYLDLQDTLFTDVDVYDFSPKGNSATVRRWRPWGFGMVEEDVEFSFSVETISFSKLNYKVLDFGRFSQSSPLSLGIERTFDGIVLLYEPDDL
jgi:hypothetical protein